MQGPRGSRGGYGPEGPPGPDVSDVLCDLLQSCSFERFMCVLFGYCAFRHVSHVTILTFKGLIHQKTKTNTIFY